MGTKNIFWDAFFIFGVAMVKMNSFILTRPGGSDVDAPECSRRPCCEILILDFGVSEKNWKMSEKCYTKE